MLWIIESSDEKQEQLSEVFQADLDRLRSNKSVADDLKKVEVSYTLEEVKQLYSADLGDEDIFVLAHSGYAKRKGHKERQPWIGGLYLDEFVDALVSKFSPQVLKGRTIWFLVCLTGKDIGTLVAQIAGKGLTDGTWYMPEDFMYISAAGIPHILSGFDDVDEANAEVAKYDADYFGLLKSKPCGGGWAGVTMKGKVPEKLGIIAVEEAIKERFDQEEDES
ncbi:MAG: hypothetical protein ACRDTE_10445 [Pseudonocardiaceae bacterium]